LNCDVIDLVLCAGKGAVRGGEGVSVFPIGDGGGSMGGHCAVFRYLGTCTIQYIRYKIR